MNVDHVHYEAGEDEGKYVCMCPCMTTERKAILTGMEFISYCNVNGWDPDAGIPDIENIKAVSALFDISIDALLSNERGAGKPAEYLYESVTEYDIDEPKRYVFQIIME